MTARNGHAEWHGSPESGSGTITVGDGVFEDAYSYEDGAVTLAQASTTRRGSKP